MQRSTGLPVALALLGALAACKPQAQTAAATPEASHAGVGAGAGGQREPDEHEVEPMLAASGVAHATVVEAFVTALTPGTTSIRRPPGPRPTAAWCSPHRQGTGKLVIFDGEPAPRRWHPGARAGAGQFERPNGIFVPTISSSWSNATTTACRCCACRASCRSASFGADELMQPYGIWLRKTGARRYEVLVTDAYMAGEDARARIVPPLAAARLAACSASASCWTGSAICWPPCTSGLRRHRRAGAVRWTERSSATRSTAA